MTELRVDQHEDRVGVHPHLLPARVARQQDFLLLRGGSSCSSTRGSNRRRRRCHDGLADFDRFTQCHRSPVWFVKELDRVSGSWLGQGTQIEDRRPHFNFYVTITAAHTHKIIDTISDFSDDGGVSGCSCGAAIESTRA